MENTPELLDLRPLLLKRFTWDIFPHDFELIAEVHSQLGLFPDNEDGMTVEHTASDARVNRVRPLGDALSTLSGLAAEVVGHYMVRVMEDEDDDTEVPEGFYESFASQNTAVIYEGAYSIIAHLMDKGVLVYGSKVTGQEASHGEA